MRQESHQLAIDEGVQKKRNNGKNKKYKEDGRSVKKAERCHVDMVLIV